MPLLRGRAEEEEEEAEAAGRPQSGAGCRAACAGDAQSVRAGERRGPRQHSRVGQRVLFLLSFIFYSSPRPPPRTERPGGASPVREPAGLRAAGRGGRLRFPAGFCPRPGRETVWTLPLRSPWQRTAGLAPFRAEEEPGLRDRDSRGSARPGGGFCGGRAGSGLLTAGSWLGGLQCGLLPLPGAWGFCIL